MNQRPLSSLLADLTLPSHRAVAQHWFELSAANGHRVPRLRDLDPLRFPAALPDIWIVDAEPDGGFRFHLAGQSLVDWYGSSPKGLTFADVYPPAVLPMITATARIVIERPAAVYQKVESLTKNWSLAIPIERLGLPLADETGTIRHLFGVTSFQTRDGHGSGPQSAQTALEYWYPIAR